MLNCVAANTENVCTPTSRRWSHQHCCLPRYWYPPDSGNEQLRTPRSYTNQNCVASLSCPCSHIGGSCFWEDCDRPVRPHLPSLSEWAGFGAKTLRSAGDAHGRWAGLMVACIAAFVPYLTAVAVPRGAASVWVVAEHTRATWPSHHYDPSSCKGTLRFT